MYEHMFVCNRRIYIYTCIPHILTHVGKNISEIINKKQVNDSCFLRGE